MNTPADFSFLVYYLPIHSVGVTNAPELRRVASNFKETFGIDCPVIPVFGGHLEGYHRVQHLIYPNIKL